MTARKSLPFFSASPVHANRQCPDDGAPFSADAEKQKTQNTKAKGAILIDKKFPYSFCFWLDSMTAKIMLGASYLARLERADLVSFRGASPSK
jgi:hypothetical protein